MLVGDQCLDLLFDRFIRHLDGIGRSFYARQELAYIQARSPVNTGIMYCYDEVFITYVSDSFLEFDCFSIIVSDGMTVRVKDSFDSPTGCHHCFLEIKDITEVEYRTVDELQDDEIDIEDAFEVSR